MPTTAWRVGIACLAISWLSIGSARTQEGPHRDDRYLPFDAFRRGDANADGIVNIADAIATLRYLFLDGAEPSCLEAADSNDDEGLDVSDATFTLLYLFRGSAAPPAPGPTECGHGTTPSQLTCIAYDACPDEIALVHHALGRLTFGATHDLLARVQTRQDVVRYIEEQLAPPDGYDPATHEPEVDRRSKEIGLGFLGPDTLPEQRARADASLLVGPLASRWQLLHVVANFWNNHFHTKIDKSREYLQLPGRGGISTAATETIFRFADADGSGGITEGEWTTLRETYPAAIDWSTFGPPTNDGVVDLQEFLSERNVGRWKYLNANEQYGGAAELEFREYQYYRRNAFGKFATLLEGASKSVAMLIYLNGWENTVVAPNENYAREYLELYSLGVDHLYTQRDIEELARVLTGMSVGWVSRASFDPDDVLGKDRPETEYLPIELQNAPPLDFPDLRYWNDDEYRWAFIVRGVDPIRETPLPDLGHDWERKDLFLPRYGGVDSLGNPPLPEDAITIEANADDRTVAAVLNEFDAVHSRVVLFRETAKFVSTKLIQLFVVDDLTLLPKRRELAPRFAAIFEDLDASDDGRIDIEEWRVPIPLVLPNGRPTAVFANLDLDGDGGITRLEYQEPDLLVEAIETWQSTDGNVREVLRTILLSDEFLSLDYRLAKVKTPLENVTSTIRALGGTPTADHLLATVLDIELAGQELLNFTDPTGESELAFDWLHTVGVLERLKFVSRATHPISNVQRRMEWSPGQLVIPFGLTSVDRYIDYLAQILYAGDLSPEHRALAVEVWKEIEPVQRERATAAFLASLPAWQKQ